MSDDLSQDFIDHRTALAQNTAAAELLQRFGKAADTAPAAKKDQDKKVPTAAEEGAGVAAAAGAVASDIGRGIVDLPGAVVSGVRDGAQEFLDSTRDLADWIDGELLGLEVDPPEDRLQLPDAPEWAEPESTTGNVVKGVAQFLAGFGVAGKALKGWKATTKTGQVGKAMTQGAIADATFFDPHEERLSNLIEKYPQLQNPVSEYLAADPTDSKAEGRFKNALEGLGLGVAAEGMFKAMKVMRSAMVVKRQQADQSRVPGAPDEMPPQVEEAEMRALLGERLDGPHGSKPEGDGQAQAGETGSQESQLTPPGPDDLQRPPEDPQTFINFARIDEPEDIKATMQRMADHFKEDVDNARRGEHRSFAQMELDANQVDAFETLMTRRQGEPLNAEQSIAARQLWAASSNRLTTLAKSAAENPSEANLFAFRKMVSTHQAIQNEVIAARTETARALASWRIPAGSSAERFMEIDKVLTTNGGTKLAREMATRVAALAEKGMHKELESFIQKGAWARTRDAMLEAWINGLLSGPKTHMVNMLSNTSVIFQQMYERHTAAKIAMVLGDEQSVKLGEATAQFFGMLSGLKDGMRYSVKAFKTGESGFGLGKVEVQSEDFPNAISSEAFNISNTSALGRTVDLMGSAIRIPTRALAAADEFFKTIGYRMELNALALRQATNEVNSGKVPSEQLKQRVGEILENPPQSIKLAAIDQATYQTFTNKPGELAQLISEAKGKFPVLNILLPFVRTPANIMRYTFERTPLAPLMKQHRADLQAGGARRDLALAKVATGTTIMMMVADMAMNGEITGKGPSDRAKRGAEMRQGWQPYSVKVDDRYFAYNRLDPIGMTMGLAADMVDILANDEYGTEPQKTMEGISVAVAMSIANNTMSKTYLSGLAEFFEAMSDPERYGDNYFQRLASSLVPTGVGEVARAQDPYMRHAGTMVESMMRKVPGLSDELPMRRNLWGEPITYQSGLGATYDAFSPIYSKSKKPSAIDQEILRLEANITMPQKRISFDGVTVDMTRYPEAYSRYLQLAGNELKHPAWKMGAKELLNKLVTGKHPLSQVYQVRSDGPDGGKADYIKKTINEYRALARDQLLREFPEISTEVGLKKQEKRRLKLPQIQGRGAPENA